ncbi:hypothetical protein Tco_1573715, partial [Tanacetum coccineum]
RAGGQYLFINFVLRPSQVVIEPVGSFLSQRLVAPVKDIGNALSITWSIVIFGMWNIDDLKNFLNVFVRNFVIRTAEVYAIVSASSSSEFSWSENKLKSDDLNSSRLNVLKCLLDDRNSRSGSLKGVNSSFVELFVMHYLKQGINNQKLDTPYPMEVDAPYRVIDQNSVLAKQLN